jgi:hypothetical protein
MEMSSMGMAEALHDKSNQIILVHLPFHQLALFYVETV